MRVLFVAPPFFGLLFPVVPLAHAMRAAGHDVLLATCGAAATDAAHAGLTVLDCAPDADVTGFYHFIRGDGIRGDGIRGDGIRGDGIRGDGIRGDGIRGDRTAVPGAGAFFGVAMADRLVEGARAWRPDLVVRPPHGSVGGLVAAVLDVPMIVHGLGWIHTEAHLDRFRDDLLDACARHGVERLRAPSAWLDIAPPSTRVVDAAGRRDLRPVPYNGGGVLPDWLREPPARPRVTVTLGTVNIRVGGLGALEWVRAAADAVDAEFVLALGSAAGEVRDLPSNVRVSDWVPLGALLANSDAVVHHGGAGTTLTAIVAGLPQLIVPGGADQPGNADAMARRGNGLRVAEVTVADVRRLLADDGLRSAAHEVRDELGTMPSPAEVAKALVDEYLS